MNNLSPVFHVKNVSSLSPFAPAFAPTSHATKKTIGLITRIPSNLEFGITYKITNKYGIESFLIGTCHHVDKESYHSGAILELIAKCTHVYTEAGVHLLHMWPNIYTLDDNPNYQHLPIRYASDVAITLTAQYYGIPVSPLDEGISACDKKFRDVKKFLRQNGPDTMEAVTMKRYEEWNQSHYVWKVLKAWKRGDCNFFREIVREDLPEETAREAHWFNTLKHRVKNTRQPIAIAVGSAHVVGEDGLAQLFANAGLNVQFMQVRPLD